LTRKARLFPFIMISHLLVYFMSFNLLYVFQHRSLSALNILQSHREFCDDFKPSVTGHPAYIPIMDLYISLRENHIGQQILRRPLGLLVCLMKHNSLPEFQFHSHRMRIIERFQVISHLPFVYIYIKQIAEATNPDINMDHNKLTKGFFEACTEWNGLKRLHFAEVQQEDLTRCWRELISCLDEVRLTLFIQYDS